MAGGGAREAVSDGALDCDGSTVRLGVLVAVADLVGVGVDERVSADVNEEVWERVPVLVPLNDRDGDGGDDGLGEDDGD